MSLAEKAFTPAERQSAIPHYERQIKNLKQRSYRAGRKATEALADWFSPLGTVEDILDFEKHAISQQLIVRQLSATEAILDGITRK